MWRFVVIGVGWGIASYGALQLNQLQLGHTICGPWGCGPPTSALLAMHSFWLVTGLALAAAARVAFPAWDWRRIGWGLVACSLGLALIIGVEDFLTWRPDAWNPEGRYLWQRFLFRLATLHDFPVTQVAIAGCLLALVPSRAGKGAVEETQPQASSPD